MKKVLAILMAAAMIFSMAACGTKKGENNVQNPWVEYESLDKLNEHFACKLAHPPVMGVTNEAFRGLETAENNIAEYQFTLGGYDYCLRFSPDFTSDISGVYVGKSTIFANVDGDANVTTGDCKAARWMNVDGQYCLVINDKGKMDAKAFDDAVEELKAIVLPQTAEDDEQIIYDNLAGEYTDSFSQRATLDLESVKGAVKGLVSWGSSASESDTWEFTMRINGEDTFGYEDCVHSRHIWDAKGNETVEVIAKNLSGYFTLNQKGDLLWDGASEADCKDCVFER